MINPEDFLACFLKEEPLLRAYLRAGVRHESAVDDLVQEVAMAAWRDLATYDEARPLGAWLRGIARHRLLDHQRRVGRAGRWLSPLSMEALDAAFETLTPPSGHQTEALERCLQTLPGADADLLRQRYVDDCALTDLAARLGRSQAAIHKQLVRLRQRLRTCLERRLGLAGG